MARWSDEHYEGHGWGQLVRSLLGSIKRSQAEVDAIVLLINDPAHPVMEDCRMAYRLLEDIQGIVMKNVTYADQQHPERTK